MNNSRDGGIAKAVSTTWIFNMNTATQKCRCWNDDNDMPRYCKLHSADNPPPDTRGNLEAAIRQHQVAAKPELTALQKLRELMGYVQNSSEAAVTLNQDDATMDYFITIKYNATRGRTYFASGFEEVIDKAYADMPKED